MSEDGEMEDKQPQIGDMVLVIGSDGEWNGEDTKIIEVGDFDEVDGLFNVTCDDNKDYQVYWSDDDFSWVHEE